MVQLYEQDVHVMIITVIFIKFKQFGFILQLRRKKKIGVFTLTRPTLSKL